MFDAVFSQFLPGYVEVEGRRGVVSSRSRYNTTRLANIKMLNPRMIDFSCAAEEEGGGDPGFQCAGFMNVNSNVFPS